jgi:hypothetical protein
MYIEDGPWNFLQAELQLSNLDLICHQDFEESNIFHLGIPTAPF